jgi:exopolysaccharide production protein ExoQ
VDHTEDRLGDPQRQGGLLMRTNPKSKNLSLLEGLTIFLVIFTSIFQIFSVARMRSFNCDTFPIKPGSECDFPFPWFTLLCLLTACAAGTYIIIRQKLWQDYLIVWKKSWLVILLLGLAMLSTIWSIFPIGTLYRSVVLILITLLAVFIGVRWNMRNVVGIFAWAMGILALMCLLVVLFFPQAGIMSLAPYSGSWSGILWHRLYLGTLMAGASMIFLIRLLEASLSRVARIASAAFFLITLVLVAGSRSATGIILAVVLNGAVILYFLWLLVRAWINKQHYWLIALAGLILVMIAVWKMDTILGVLGRNSSLTGRIPLWNYLMTNYILQRPWLGHGFGVFWGFNGIHMQAQTALGWMYPVLNGDNGWVDIALHLGAAGVVVFTLILIRFGVYAFRLLKRQHDMLAFFPAGMLLFIIISNISLSLFLELEFLTWLMLISTQCTVLLSQFQEKPLQTKKRQIERIEV